MNNQTNTNTNDSAKNPKMLVNPIQQKTPATQPKKIPGNATESNSEKMEKSSEKHPADEDETLDESSV